MPAPTHRDGAYRVVAVLCLTYAVSQFYRSSNAVIAPDLAREMALTPEALGAVTGAFFLAFAAAQIPVGMLLDRYGARLTIHLLIGLAVLGSVVFAAAEGVTGLIAGRALMGVGMASVLMGAMVACSRWFPPDRFATLAAILIATGNLGGILSTAPLALVADAIGWRGAFFAMAAVTAAIGVIGYTVIRDAPPGHTFHRRRPEPAREVLRGVGEVLRDRRLPFIFVAAFVAYAAIITILGLWGGPYLSDVHGLDAVARGKVLMVMAAAIILGNLIYGPLDRVLDTRKGLVVFGMVATIAIFAVLALAPRLALWQVTALFGLLGLAGSYNVIVFAHARALFPERLVGRGITIVNLASMGGPAVLQIAAGAIIGAFPATAGVAPAMAYRTVFVFLGVALFAALLFYLRLDDARPSDDDMMANGDKRAPAE